MKRAKPEAPQTATEADQSTQTASKWSKLLPSRLLVVSLEMSHTRDVAAAITACKSWKKQNLDLLWRRLYLRDWESETAEDNAVAVEGKDTSWFLRYKRRLQGERNFHAGKGRLVQLKVPFARSACQCGQYLALASIKGDLALVDTQNGNKLVNQAACSKESKLDNGSAPPTIISDGSLIYIADFNPKGIISYSVPDLKEGKFFAYPDAPAFMMRANGKQLVAAGQAHVLVWNVASGELKLAFKPERWLISMQVDWESDVFYGFTGSGFTCYSLTTGVMLSEVSLTADPKVGVRLADMIAFHAPSRSLFAAHRNGTLFKLTVPLIPQRLHNSEQLRKESEDTKQGLKPVLVEHTKGTRITTLIDGLSADSRRVVTLVIREPSPAYFTVTSRLPTAYAVSSTSSTKSNSNSDSTVSSASAVPQLRIDLAQEWCWNPLLGPLRIFYQAMVSGQKDTALFMLDFAPD